MARPLIRNADARRFLLAAHGLCRPPGRKLAAGGLVLAALAAGAGLGFDFGVGGVPADLPASFLGGELGPPRAFRTAIGGGILGVLASGMVMGGGAGGQGAGSPLRRTKQELQEAFAVRQTSGSDIRTGFALIDAV